MQHSLTSAALVALHRVVTADPDFAALPLEGLRPLPTTGLTHDHFRLGDNAWLARVPKQSQFGFAAHVTGQAQPCRLIATDAHPGNWLVREGKAVLVDWEKGQYSSPAVDLAHASLYTSTTWDVVAAGAPSLATIVGFYQDWLGQAEPALAAAVRHYERAT